MGDANDVFKTAVNPIYGTKKVIGWLSPEDPPAAREAPVPDDATSKRAKERAAQRRYAKAGRAGTVLSSDTDKLG